MKHHIISSNTVLVNSLNTVEDIITFRLKNRPKKIIFDVGTHIDGIPHIGTYIVLAASFLIAQRVKEKFSIQTEVVFTALDNGPYKSLRVKGKTYYQTYGQSKSVSWMRKLIDSYYGDLIHKLSLHADSVSYTVQTYSQQQSSPVFRRMFFLSLKHISDISQIAYPSGNVYPLRLTCPKCGFTEKNIEKVKLLELTHGQAIFQSSCFEHGLFKEKIYKNKAIGYINPNSLLRNILKEAVYAVDSDSLCVSVKGNDWSAATQFIGWGLQSMKIPLHNSPLHLFTPQIVNETGNKLSKSTNRLKLDEFKNIPRFLTDMKLFMKKQGDYAERIIWLVNEFLKDTRHFYRIYTDKEIVKLFRLYDKHGKRKTLYARNSSFIPENSLNFESYNEV